VVIVDPLAGTTATDAANDAANDATSAAASTTDTPAPVPDRAVLRCRVGALLAALAARIEPALRECMERAMRAWDQVDNLTLVDASARAEAERLRRDWRRLHRAAIDGRTAEPCADTAAALEALLTIDAALGLASLLERRMATLARLRLRSPDPNLLPDGRPFLDLAAALAEAARGWA
jgi:hypothetical protein